MSPVSFEPSPQTLPIFRSLSPAVPCAGPESVPAPTRRRIWQGLSWLLGLGFSCFAIQVPVPAGGARVRAPSSLLLPQAPAFSGPKVLQEPKGARVARGVSARTTHHAPLSRGGACLRSRETVRKKPATTSVAPATPGVGGTMYVSCPPQATRGECASGPGGARDAALGTEGNVGD